MAADSFRKDEVIKTQGFGPVMRRLFVYLTRYPFQILLVLVAMLLSVGITIVNPLLIEEAVDSYAVVGDFGGLLRLGLFALVINLIYILLLQVRMYTMARVCNQILMDLRQELYEHVQALSLSYFNNHPTGKILSRIIKDVNSLKEIFDRSITSLVPQALTLVGVMGIMFWKNALLALATLCCLPLMAIAVVIISRLGHREWTSFRKKESNLNAYIHEDIAGIRVVQSLCAEEETCEELRRLADDHASTFIRACRISDHYGPAIEISWGISAAMLYLVSILFRDRSDITIGLLIAFGTYINMFWEPIISLSNFVNRLTANISAAERVFDLLDAPIQIADAPYAKDIDHLEGKVEFSHVSFTYDIGTEAETKVLSDVSFTVNPGETIALVGPTGAGKTTIVSLISRFFDIQEGQILLDDRDLQTITLHSLRSHMGVMTQENFIFHGTVRENIAYGKENATDEEIIAAAKAVGLHDLILQMENGYDTKLKELGAGLSIGQRQLIAFARTLVSQPQILILDEATSSIDTHTELMVQKGIAALLKDRTSFVIAHRLSTIQNADRIFVVDDGGILEAGSPAELMAKKGLYYQLYTAQFAEIA